MSRSTTEVKEFFERVASDWNTMRLAYYDERVIERMAEMSGVGKSSEVADVGIITSFEVTRRRAKDTPYILPRTWVNRA